MHRAPCNFSFEIAMLTNISQVSKHFQVNEGVLFIRVRRGNFLMRYRDLKDSHHHFQIKVESNKVI